MGYLKILLLALVATLGVLLIVQNMDTFNQAASVKLNLYFWECSSNPYPLYLLIVLSFLLGVFLTSLLGFCERIRIRGAIKAAARQKEALEKELTSLRKLSYNIASQAGGADRA